MIRMKPITLQALFLLGITFGQSDLPGTVVPNGLFADHMLLQRDRPIPVWGKADPGEKVSVVLDGDKVMAVADNDGFWKCELPARFATTLPKALSITSDRMPGPVVIHDILIGDVWLCAGQSNMTLYLKYLTNYPGVSDDIAKADYPMVRLGSVSRQPSIMPVTSRSVTWNVCSPDTVGMFSAPAFYFARAVQKELGVPIGVILSSFGSTCTEEWISKEALDSDPLSRKRLEQQQERYRTALAADQAAKTWNGAIKGKVRSWLFKDTPPNPSKILNKTATAHYNGMIHPLAPFPIKGVIWYQGEEEALEKRAKDHGIQLELLINDWRRLWGNPKLPFMIQQLPEFKGEGPEMTEWSELREAQAQVVEKTPGTYLVCGFGAGEPEGLHPANKREIGRRWGLAVLKEIYGRKIPASGPVFESMTVEDGKIRVHFKNAKGLATADGMPPNGFYIRGEDQSFVPAKAHIEGTSVVLSSEQVPRPIAVRYAFRNVPTDLNLTNDSRLPAFPFRAEASQ